MRVRHAISSVSLLMALILLTACAAAPDGTSATTGTTATSAATTTAAAATTTTQATTGETTAVEPPAAEMAELVWLHEYTDAEFASRSLAMHPDGERVTVGAYLATYTHRLYDGGLTDVDTGYRHGVDSLAYSADGRYLAAGLAMYGVVVKDTSGEIEPIQVHGGYNNFVAFSNDTDLLATGNRSADIWLWSLPDGGQILELPDEERGFLWGLAFHPSGDQVASVQWRDDGVLQIWSVEEERIIQTFSLDILVGNTLNVIDYSPNGTYFAMHCREDGKHLIRIYDPRSYRLVAEFEIDTLANQIAFSPDETMIAVASVYEPVSIWSTATGQLLYTLDQVIEDRSGGASAAAFTPDGGHIAVVRSSGNLELWRLPGAEPLPEPQIDLYQPVPIPGDVLFDTGSADLKPAADEILADLAEEILAALPAAKLTFVGHTDSRGDASANMRLSLERATSVMNWFAAWAADNEADGWTFAVDGKGESALKAVDVDGEGNFREEAGQVNRRVEIEIAPAG